MVEGGERGGERVRPTKIRREGERGRGTVRERRGSYRWWERIRDKGGGRKRERGR